ncbi:MAG: hypothetical protein MJ195_00180 [Mycoplasmoidaceae bacterium]|nr:hypothetical protein [Mycoplasmoidaceae bacterium]
MSANINKCSLNIDEGAVYANFFGYVNFIFNKDYVDHKTNDFIQITIVMDNVTVTPSSNL